MQIGKNGVSENFLSNLKSAFKTHELVKIHILKNAGRDREKAREMASKLLVELGNKYTCRIVGFTLVIRKWRKAVR